MVVLYLFCLCMMAVLHPLETSMVLPLAHRPGQLGKAAVPLGSCSQRETQPGLGRAAHQKVNSDVLPLCLVPCLLPGWSNIALSFPWGSAENK